MTATRALATKRSKSKTKVVRQQKTPQSVPDAFSSAQAQHPLIQRKQSACPCGGFCPRCQNTGGDNSLDIQTKLTISEPGDQYEREADQVADKIVQRQYDNNLQKTPHREGLAVQRMPAITVQHKLQRAIDTKETPADVTEETEEDSTPDFQLQAKAAGAGSPNEEETPPNAITPKANLSRAVPYVPNRQTTMALQMDNARGSGLPLSGTIRQAMEQSFRTDFRHVRIHTNGNSHQLNKQLNAQAFTTGQDIFFSPGRFRPGSKEGDRLLAHELTHVIQQQGAASINRPNLQRKAEDKAHLGTTAHREIEKLLERDNSNLITEAPIPGGTRNGKALNNVGFADLYKSSGNIVAGVQGFYKGKDAGNHDPALRPLYYKNMPTPATSDKFTKWGRLHSAASITHGPRKRDGKWDTTPDFPKNFHIGEIKPMMPNQFKLRAVLGVGFAQLGNYSEGLKEFVERAHKDNSGVTRRTSNYSGALSSLTLAKPIDYDEFASQATNDTNAAAILFKSSKERLWVKNLGNGLYVYFLLPYPFAPNKPAPAIAQHDSKLEELLKDIKKPHKQIGTSLKLLPGKRPPSLFIQRQRKGPKQKDDKWKKAGKLWEEKRSAWATGKGKRSTQNIDAKEMLKKEGKAATLKHKIDEKLNHTPKHKKLLKTHKSIDKIKFWSSTPGKLLGALRFKFGTAFDKVLAFYKKMKKKFKDKRLAANKLKRSEGILGGWRKTATKIIIGIAAKGFKKLLSRAFAAFAACANGIINNIVGRFAAEGRDKLKAELDPVLTKVETFRTDLETRYNTYNKELDTFTGSIETYQQWGPVLDAVEVAARVGVQVVSCGSPPGLGCLWGLVAQLVAIGPAIELLTNTNYFEENIAEPAADKLLDAVFGNSFQSLVASAVEAGGLQDYAKGVSKCQPPVLAVRGFHGGKGKFDPNNPKLRKAVEEWEKKHGTAILKDLQKYITGTDGKPATLAELKALVEAIKKSGKTPDELKELFKKSQDSKTKKLDATTFVQQLAGNTGTGSVKEGDGTEGGVPILDASKAATATPTGSGSPRFRVEVAAHSGHTAHKSNPFIKITVWVFEGDKAVLQIKNVSAKVVKRTFHPKGSNRNTTQKMKVHYLLEKPVALAPHLPGISLTGGSDKIIHGYFDW